MGLGKKVHVVYVLPNGTLSYKESPDNANGYGSVAGLQAAHPILGVFVKWEEGGLPYWMEASGNDAVSCYDTDDGIGLDSLDTHPKTMMRQSECFHIGGSTIREVPVPHLIGRGNGFSGDMYLESDKDVKLAEARLALGYGQ